MNKLVKLKNLKGIFPILYSFFNKNNSLDIKLMRDQISLINDIKSHGITCLGLATEVHKLDFNEKVKIIELMMEKCSGLIPTAVTIQANNFREYVKLINIAKSNKADWIILQPLLKNNITDKDCFDFFDQLIPFTINTVVGVQNAKEYLGVGLNSYHINKLYNKYSNFRAIKGEASSVFMQEEIKKYPKDLVVFNGRGGQEIIDNLTIGCRGIVPCLDGADKLIKIYEYFKLKKIDKAEKEYNKIIPVIVFIMQSIENLVCYGKRVCAYRMGIKNVYDRDPFLKPTDFGIKKAKTISDFLGKF